MDQAPEIHSADAPQEDNLGDVRRTVEAVAQGLEDTQSIADRTQRSRRHVGYAINAAIVLGWIAEGEERLTVLDDGKKLLAHPAGSAEERAFLRAAIGKSPALKALAPDLLAAVEPERATISERIQKLAGLSKSTSDRRAQTLLSWRRQVL
jgi:hypothetical protein